MYSSPKFFVPSVIVTLDGEAEPVVVVLPLLPPPPQAARPIRSATPKEIANAALAARRVCLRNMQSLLSWLPRLGLSSAGPYALGAIRRGAARWASPSTKFVKNAIPAATNAAASTPAPG